MKRTKKRRRRIRKKFEIEPTRKRRRKVKKELFSNVPKEGRPSGNEASSDDVERRILEECRKETVEMPIFGFGSAFEEEKSFEESSSGESGEENEFEVEKPSLFRFEDEKEETHGLDKNSGTAENVVTVYRRRNERPKKYYAVAEGRIRGIYTTWEECSEQVTGYPCNKHKSFKMFNDAVAFLRDHGLDVVVEEV